ncbi:MAG TPA: type II toxin-antitoxin system RelE/ParE family toxin [Acidobacteriaceae bacterium]|nr:type II toxin-antitoxin system RelE/ParE family toxin [Acidobacteriaceae bacterium]
MQIRWTPNATDDLERIAAYLKEHHPGYAESTVRELNANVQSLQKFPRLGRLGREEGTRELVFGRLPYVAVYRVKDEAVEVLRIWHAAQNRL